MLYSCDLSSLRQVRVIGRIKSIVRETGNEKIDVLVNNADGFQLVCFNRGRP